MKINGQPISADVDQSGAATRTAATQAKDSRVKGNQSAQSSTDRVEVSSDARLRNTALAAAEAAPEIRQDRVDAVRQKLAAGEIGSDLNRLADRLLDDLTGKVT